MGRQKGLYRKKTCFFYHFSFPDLGGKAVSGLALAVEKAWPFWAVAF
jgi:hypothetical protein